MTITAALFWLMACDAPSHTLKGIPKEVIVHDGDTVTVNRQKIRLWGIDAIELEQTCRYQGQLWRCGQAAKNALVRKLNGTLFVCHQKDTDRYGRTVAECFMDGESINGWLVQQGYALAYRRFTTKFIQDEQTAKAEARGIWQSQFIAPWLWRQQNRR